MRRQDRISTYNRKLLPSSFPCSHPDLLQRYSNLGDLTTFWVIFGRVVTARALRTAIFQFPVEILTPSLDSAWPSSCTRGVARMKFALVYVQPPENISHSILGLFSLVLKRTWVFRPSFDSSLLNYQTFWFCCPARNCNIDLWASAGPWRLIRYSHLITCLLNFLTRSFLPSVSCVSRPQHSGALRLQTSKWHDAASIPKFQPTRLTLTFDLWPFCP